MTARPAVLQGEPGGPSGAWRASLAWLASVPVMCGTGLAATAVEGPSLLALWARTSRERARHELSLAADALRCWLFPIRTPAAALEEGRRRWSTFVLTPGWSWLDGLETGLGVLGVLVGAKLPGQRLTLFAYGDDGRAVAVAGDLVGAAAIADNWLPLLLDELRAGELVVTHAPLGALWLPLSDRHGLAGCVLARATGHGRPVDDDPHVPRRLAELGERRGRAVGRALDRLTAMLREAQRA